MLAAEAAGGTKKNPIALINISKMPNILSAMQTRSWQPVYPRHADIGHNDAKEFRAAAEAYWEAGRIYDVLSKEATDSAEKRFLEDRVGYMNHIGNVTHYQVE